jgi:hypothetical protein
MANTTSKKPKEAVDRLDWKDQAFNYQLEMLKTEIGIINQTIARFDEHARATRNWAVVTWAGSIAIALGNQDLRQYIVLTGILPIIFWLIDARWTSVLRGFLYRQKKVSEFLNDPKYAQSFKEKHLIDFKLLDPKGRQYENNTDYKKSVSLWGAMWKYGEVTFLYFGLMLISVGLGLFFIFVK